MTHTEKFRKMNAGKFRNMKASVPFVVAVRAALSLTLLLAAFVAAPDVSAQRRRAQQRRTPSAAKKGATTPAPKVRVPAAWRAALESVSAEEMRGHLSFLSSDALEGRKTPSRGLDIAAEYIAAQFRAAGLEPAGDDGYFQTADWQMVGRDTSALRVSFTGAGGGLSLRPEQVGLGYQVSGLSFWTPDGELALDGAGVFKVNAADTSAVSALTREQVGGRVVVTEYPPIPRGEQARAMSLMRARNDFQTRAHALGAALVVSFERATERARSSGAPRLVDPKAAASNPVFGDAPAAPLVTVYGAEAARFFDSLPSGATDATLTLQAPAPTRAPARVRNVAGILRGSHPVLRDTYVVVSAHYDHLGMKPEGEAGDRVYNGANDDGSGTVGVVTIARALSEMKVKPKRSVLFITFFGEELGLVGSRFYGRNPLVPLAKTVAQINMEQIGRTDDSEGPQISTASVTGFDFSDVGATLERAGAAVGVRVYKHPKNSDAYFGRSDNQSLADAGVPAHTLGVTFGFPDYHGVGDEWQKIDFANMERVVRAVSLGALLIADDAREPRWDESNPKAARYVEAWRKLHGK